MPITALILGKEDDGIFAFFHEALNYLTLPNPQVGDLLHVEPQVR